MTLEVREPALRFKMTYLERSHWNGDGTRKTTSGDGLAPNLSRNLSPNLSGDLSGDLSQLWPGL